MKKKQLLCRLAFRVEGHFWIAYYAPLGTMQDALVMGSIAMSIVDDRPEIKEAFMDLMKASFAMIAAENGTRITDWSEHPAPEHERSRNS